MHSTSGITTLSDLLAQHLVSLDIATFEDGSIEIRWRKRFDDDHLSDERFWPVPPGADLSEVPLIVQAYEDVVKDLDARFGFDGWSENQIKPAVELLLADRRHA